MNAKWSVVRRACLDHGLEVGMRGSEAIVKGVGREGQFRTQIISHECCRSPNADVGADYIGALRRKFGVRIPSGK